MCHIYIVERQKIKINKKEVKKMKYVVGDKSFRKLERALQYAHKIAKKYGWSIRIEKYETKEQEREWLHGKIVCKIEGGKEYWFE